MDNLCIMFSGDYGVGKTTVSKKLQKILNNAVHFSLANGIRDELEEKLNIGKNLLYSKPTPPYIRGLLQSYGSYKKEIIDDTIWCKILYNKYIESKSSILIIDDIRFTLEYEFFKLRFKDIRTFFIGDKSNNYNLPDLYSVFENKLPLKPSLEEVLKRI